VASKAGDGVAGADCRGRQFVPETTGTRDDSGRSIDSGGRVKRRHGQGRSRLDWMALRPAVPAAPPNQTRLHRPRYPAPAKANQPCNDGGAEFHCVKPNAGWEALEETVEPGEHVGQKHRWIDDRQDHSKTLAQPGSTGRTSATCSNRFSASDLAWSNLKSVRFIWRRTCSADSPRA